MALDISALWDFANPEVSEQRFRAALAAAQPDEALILQTKIARSYGLRGDFTRALQILDEMAPALSTAGAEAQVRHTLELGRCYCSATHPQDSQTAEVKERARSLYMQAYELAKANGLDDLGIDALHMMTFVDTAPQEQLGWNEKALALMESSTQPAARKWEASLRNNKGYALHQLGRYDEALREFKLALAARERAGKPEEIRIAHWMMAWTLRAMDRVDEALAIQLRLERECDEAGQPDPYVFEELELLYRALKNDERAGFYAERRKANAA
jgi:tetratricopeptide (TPR) repeat protein